MQATNCRTASTIATAASGSYTKPGLRPAHFVAMKKPKLSDITPGEILLEDWMKPNALSGNELSRRTGIPASRLTEIIKGRRAVTADTALRLGRFFGTGERFWLNLQQSRDIELARTALGPRLTRDIEPLVA